MMITKMKSSVPHLDVVPFRDHIRSYKSFSSSVELFKVEIDRAHNFCIDEYFSINAFSCPSAY